MGWTVIADKIFVIGDGGGERESAERKGTVGAKCCAAIYAVIKIRAAANVIDGENRSQKAVAKAASSSLFRSTE